MEIDTKRLLYCLGIGLMLGLLLSSILPAQRLLGLGIGIVIGAVGYFLPVGLPGGKKIELPFNQESRLYEQLLNKARGDKALVNRLIAYEKKLSPNGSRAELVRAALDRWERDARR